MYQSIVNFFQKKNYAIAPRFKAPCALDLTVPSRVLVFAPHPDDDILGCGGTLFKLAKTANVCVVLVTDGSGAGELPTGTDKVRQGEFQRALDLLGISSIKFLDQPDGFFKSNERLRDDVVDILMSFEPDWVFFPARFDYHRDHILISEFVHNTVAAVSKRTRLIEYETSAPVQATHLVDITDIFSVKIAALAMHETALACGDYTRAITGLNSYRGLYLGFDKFAEAFNLRSDGGVSIFLRAQGVFWKLRYFWQRRVRK